MVVDIFYKFQMPQEKNPIEDSEISCKKYIPVG